MEEILSSIKRIIAEDKAVETTETPVHKTIPDVEEDDEVLELTEEVQEEHAGSAHGVFGDRRREERPIDEDKLDSMRQSLSALVSPEAAECREASNHSNGTSLEDLTRELMRPMLKNWLDENLPQLVEELVAREIERITKN